MSPNSKHASDDSWPGHPVTLDEIKRSIDDLREENNRRFDGLDTMLRGDGADRVGVFTRLDRLEQRAESATFWTRTAVGAALAALCAEVVSWFKHGGGGHP